MGEEFERIQTVSFSNEPRGEQFRRRAHPQGDPSLAETDLCPGGQRLSHSKSGEF